MVLSGHQNWPYALTSSALQKMEGLFRPEIWVGGRMVGRDRIGLGMGCKSNNTGRYPNLSMNAGDESEEW